MGPVEVREFCRLDDNGRALVTKVRAAMAQLGLIALAFHRRRGADAPAPHQKLARTIADLDAAPTIKTHHLAEALQYHPRRQSSPS